MTIYFLKKLKYKRSTLFPVRVKLYLHTDVSLTNLTSNKAKILKRLMKCWYLLSSKKETDKRRHLGRKLKQMDNY